MAVKLTPITDDRLALAGAFLHEHLNHRISAAQWVAAVDVPWVVDRPNAGFMLVDAESDAVVGVHLAFYSERVIGDQVERFCNLGAWCVLPAYRIQGLRLQRALLAQEGYHFTDLSPSGNVVELNRRQRFRFLDTATTLVLCLPWPSRPGRRAVSADPHVIEQALCGPQLGVYRDHAAAGAARQVILRSGSQSCHVVFRKDRRKGLPLFASILYVSDPELFRTLARPLARHLLLRHGAPLMLAEERIVAYRPRLSLRLRAPRSKMFRSASLEPAQIDDLYSELVCVAW